MDTEIQQQTPTHKLSALMREGAKLHPQNFIFYVETDEHYTVTHTCAIGAAYEAFTGGKQQDWHDMSFADTLKMFAACNIDRIERVIHPVRLHHDTLEDIIPELNDTYKWTREQIADWLESIGY